MLLINDKYKYIIVTTPKSGCSTVRSLYQKIHLNEFPPHIQQTIDENSFHNNKYYYISHNLKDIEKVEYHDYYKVGIVRNSYSRVCSAYFNQFLEIQYEFTFKGIKKPHTFVEFINTLSNLQNDHHFKPQETHPLIDKYIQLENLYEGLHEMYTHVNLEADQMKIFMNARDTNMIRESSPVIKIDFGRDLSTYNFQEDPDNLSLDPTRIPHYKNMLNDKTSKMIYEFYKTEIDKFNY